VPEHSDCARVEECRARQVDIDSVDVGVAHRPQQRGGQLRRIVKVELTGQHHTADTENFRLVPDAVPVVVPQACV